MNSAEQTGVLLFRLSWGPVRRLQLYQDDGMLLAALLTEPFQTAWRLPGKAGKDAHEP